MSSDRAAEVKSRVPEMGGARCSAALEVGLEGSGGRGRSGDVKMMAQVRRGEVLNSREFGILFWIEPGASGAAEGLGGGVVM